MDVQIIGIGAADKPLRAVCIHSVHMIQLHGVVVLVQSPGKLNLTGGIEYLIHHKALRSFRGIGPAVGELQLTQVQLVTGHIGFREHLHTDCRDISSGIGRQVEFHRLPPAGLLPGIRYGQNNRILRSILENQSQRQGRTVICRGLVVNQRQRAVRRHFQISLVQVDLLRLAGLQVAVNGQRRAAVVGADLLIVKRAGGAVQQNLFLLGAVVPIQVQRGSFALHPPLPGGHKVLQVHVGPAHIPGNFAVQEILHAVTVVEVGNEYGPVDGRPLGNEVGQAGPYHFLAHFHISAVHVVHGVIQNALLGAGVPHPLPLFGDPLIPVGVADIVGLPVRLMDKVAAPESQAHLGIAGLIQIPVVQVFHSRFGPAVAAGIQLAAFKPAHAAFDAQENRLIGIQTQLFGMRHRVVDPLQVPPVVQPDGVGDPTVDLVLHPVAVLTVKLIEVGNAAVVVDGVIPLNVAPLLPHPGHHFLEHREKAAVEGAFLVDEVAVEAVVVHQVNELLTIGEVAVLVFVQPLFGILGISGDKILTQGPDTIFMSGIDERGDGDGHHAVFVPALLRGGLRVKARGGPAAGADEIGILPELKQVVIELVVVLVAVPGGLSGVGGTVVAHGHVINQGIRLQVGVGLRGCKGLVALLQRNLRPEFLTVVVCLRGPVQHVYKAVAVLPWLIGIAGLALGFLFPRLCGSGGKAKRRT